MGGFRSPLILKKMELKKEFLGQNIFVKSLGRNVVVNDENLPILIRFDFLFKKEKPVKNDSVAATSGKSGKRRTKSKPNGK